MGWIAIAFGAFLAFGIISTVVKQRKNPMADVPREQLPESARALLGRIVPDFAADTTRMSKDGRYIRLRGQYQGTPYSVSIDYDTSGGLDEFEFETQLGGRMRSGIERTSLPAVVAAEIDRVLGDARPSYEERSLAKGTMRGGPFAGEESYSSSGHAHDLEWDIEVSGSGRLLEVEIEARRER